jgi:hypothetical protein
MTTGKMNYLKGQTINAPVCAKQLLHLGSRAAVDQAHGHNAKKARKP